MQIKDLLFNLKHVTDVFLMSCVKHFFFFVS